MAKETTSPPPNSRNRENVLLDMSVQFEDDFRERGLRLPPLEERNFGCGFGHRNLNGKRLYEVHVKANSAEGKAEVFISPLIADTMLVLPVLHQALCEVAANHHGKKLHQVASKLGWDGPRKNMQAQGWLVTRFEQIAKIVGKYPHAALTLGSLNASEETEAKILGAPKPQVGRMLKAICSGTNDDGSTCTYSGRAPKSGEHLLHCALHGATVRLLPPKSERGGDQGDLPLAAE